MFHVKICGVRLQSDIDAVAESSADAIGLNFFAPSVRFVDPDDQSTRRLSDHAAESGLTRVGVFVNHSEETILGIVDSIGLEIVQLHGDESLEMAATLVEQDLSVLRAIKLPTGPLTVNDIESHTQAWRSVGAALLLDADAGPAHGGSGKTLDWTAIRDWSERLDENNWVLAGGLNPQNIAAAIRESGATRVDVASGVEEPRGVKSANRIRSFSEIARRELSVDE